MNDNVTDPQPPEQDQNNQEFVELIENVYKNRPEQIPEQFKGDAKAAAKSYVELQREYTRSRQELAQLKSTQPEPEDDNSGDTPEGLLSFVDKDKQEEADDLDWQAIGQELADNNYENLSDESMNKIRNLGVPDEIIDGFIESQRSRVTTQKTEAVKMVGGEQNLKRLVDWSKNNKSPQELKFIQEQLNTNNWRVVLRGLFAEYTESGGQTSQSPKRGGSVPPQQASDVQPFQSLHEMNQAMADPNLNMNPEAIQLLNRRIAETRKRFGKAWGLT